MPNEQIDPKWITVGILGILGFMILNGGRNTPSSSFHVHPNAQGFSKPCNCGQG